MAAGSKIGRNTPLLGLAFLISAITRDEKLAQVNPFRGVAKQGVRHWRRCGWILENQRLVFGGQPVAHAHRKLFEAHRIVVTLVFDQLLVPRGELRKVGGRGDAESKTVRAPARVRQRSHDQGAEPASFRVVATNCSSFFCAAPDATTARARSMPSAIEPATFAA